MGLYQRDGSPSWWVDFTVNGQQVRRSTKTADKKLAEQIERKWRREAEEQILLGKAASMTLTAACERYFNTVIKPRQQNLKSSATNTLYMLSRVSSDLGDNLPLESLTKEQIAKWRDGLVAKGRAPAYIDRLLGALMAVLNRAHDEWGCLPVVPKVKPVGGHNERVRYLSADEESALLMAAKDRDLRELIAFAIDTGCRRADALQLSFAAPEDVQFGAGLVGFWHTKTDVPRSVPMTQRVRAILERRATERPGMRVFPYDPDSLVKEGGRKGRFGRPPKGRTSTGLKAAWESALEVAQIDDLHFHDLRHTFATRLVSKGVELFDVAKLMGHSDTRMTMRYSHFGPSQMAASVAVLNEGAISV